MEGASPVRDHLIMGALGTCPEVLSVLITSLVRPQDCTVWIDRGASHGRVVVACRAHWQRRDQG
jgi:hypothetical protein